MTYVPSGVWQIDHQCPQCGAPVTLNEADRLLLCPYCRTKLYLVTDDHFQYCIPTKDSTRRDIIHIPYWRLKGLSFSVLAGDVANRFFDTNLLAIDMRGLPYSLGLRPQALRLTFASPGVKGRFLEPGIDARAVMQRIGADAACYHQAFIGEIISLIHCPVYLENNMLYDALLERPLCPVKSEDMDGLLAKSHSQNWQVRFISTQCPRCGWDLLGEKDTLVLTCTNCESAWTCRVNTFESVEFSVITDVEPAPHYLPFWRMKPSIEGIPLRSYADLIRLGNLPKVITSAFEETPLYFWSPAFKVNPALFLRWSRQMTVFQSVEKKNGILPRTSLYPVTLSSGEAQENIMITIANLITEKRRLFPLLSGIRIDLDEVLLEYHPFAIARNELIHTKLRLSIDKNALAFGTQL
jgi:uncharacterized Zn finger protein (UPF0148 family)